MKELHTNVLGTDYKVLVGKRKEIGIPKKLRGQCCNYLKQVMVEHSMRGCDTEEEKNVLTTEVVAHEMFHAFVNESGLDIPEDVEETLALWYEKNWRKLNNSIIGLLDELNLLDI